VVIGIARSFSLCSFPLALLSEALLRVVFRATHWHGPIWSQVLLHVFDFSLFWRICGGNSLPRKCALVIAFWFFFFLTFLTRAWNISCTYCCLLSPSCQIVYSLHLSSRPGGWVYHKPPSRLSDRAVPSHSPSFRAVAKFDMSTPLFSTAFFFFFIHPISPSSQPSGTFSPCHRSISLLRSVFGGRSASFQLF